MTARDHQTMEWVRRFNAYDLYSKGGTQVPVAQVRPFYEELIARYFPAQLDW
jgi:inositol oxygenase